GSKGLLRLNKDFSESISLIILTTRTPIINKQCSTAVAKTVFQRFYRSELMRNNIVLQKSKGGGATPFFASGLTYKETDRFLRGLPRQSTVP
ncbi:MAG: hypothetical protein OXF23_01410, partial [Candidatus Dadabacteria bacterium]|nr:hypothetical protein [Candidatus Dadabacteria bacterium]